MSKGFCRDCWHVHTFKPRPDEQRRYGFGEIGYGCRYPGYEGYTKAESSCPSFRLADAMLTERERGE